MIRIMADHNIEGHVELLLRIWTSDAWRALWEELEIEIESFERLGLRYNTSDRELWRICQQQQIILITANRNDDGHDSLETTIRELNTLESLPVLTVADPDAVLLDAVYAERVAVQVLEYLIEMDNLRGTGRLFVP